LKSVGKGWKNEKVLQRFKVKRNIPHTTELRKANWTGHILCRNCLLKHVIEGKIERMVRRGRRRTQLLDDIGEEIRYIELERALALKEAVDLYQY
jgi:hypothetical protein